MTRTFVRFGGVAVAVVALAACGSSSKKSAAPPPTAAPTTAAAADSTTVSTAPAAADLNSCELVTKQQATALIGSKLLDGTHSHTSDVDSCTYAGDPNGPTAQVEVFIGAGAKTYYDDDNSVLHHTFTNVAGLGDESHEEDGTVFFRKGDTWVAIRVTSLDDFSKFKPGLESLAKSVDANM